MSKTIINAVVADQELKLSTTPLIASGGNDENVVKFEFSEHWADFEKTAVFYRYGGEHYHIPIDENNECTIPWEVLQWQGSFYFGVFGTLGESVRTSNVIAYDVKQGAFSSGEEIAITSPNIYTEILNRIARLEKGGGSDTDGGGTSFTTDETLTLKDGILSVNTAHSVEEDNTLPITSAAVYTEIGNINVLLETI